MEPDDQTDPISVLIGRNLDTGAHPYDAADAALYEVLAPIRSGAVRDAIATRLSGLVRGEAVGLARKRTRKRENAAWRDAESAGGVSALDVVRERLVADGFQVGGEWVSWLDASAEQHELRAAEQRERAAFLVVDAERHEEAARAIRAAGVSCLRELGAGVLVAAD